jgi:uncharacterized membrane protein
MEVNQKEETMRATTATKADVKAKSSFGAVLLVITFRVAFIITLLVLVSIAVWAGLALFGGAISAGDPLAMISEWFKAIQGN